MIKKIFILVPMLSFGAVATIHAAPIYTNYNTIQYQGDASCSTYEKAHTAIKTGTSKNGGSTYRYILREACRTDCYHGVAQDEYTVFESPEQALKIKSIYSVADVGNADRNFGFTLGQDITPKKVKLKNNPYTQMTNYSCHYSSRIKKINSSPVHDEYQVIDKQSIFDRITFKTNKSNIIISINAEKKYANHDVCLIQAQSIAKDLSADLSLDAEHNNNSATQLNYEEIQKLSQDKNALKNPEQFLNHFTSSPVAGYENKDGRKTNLLCDTDGTMYYFLQSTNQMMPN